MLICQCETIGCLLQNCTTCDILQFCRIVIESPRFMKSTKTAVSWVLCEIFSLILRRFALACRSFPWPALPSLLKNFLTDCALVYQFVPTFVWVVVHHSSIEFSSDSGWFITIDGCSAKTFKSLSDIKQATSIIRSFFRFRPVISISIHTILLIVLGAFDACRIPMKNYEKIWKIHSKKLRL